MSRDSFDPYRPPIQVDSRHPGARHKPQVVTWFKLYCVGMGLLYLFVLALGVLLLTVDPAETGEEVIVLRVQGVLCCGLGLVLAGVFFAGVAVPAKSWGWVYGIVLIAIGLTSVCCLPATVPLLIYWIKDDVKAYFGRK